MAVNKRLSTTCSYKYGPGVFLQAVVVHRCRAATVEGLRGRVDLQRFRQTPVSLQSDALLVTFKSEKTKDVTVAANWDIIRTELKRKKKVLPGLIHLLLSEEQADVHGVAELHVRQFARHGDGCISAVERQRTASNRENA